MTNKPTIDGVSRELIAEAALTLRLAGGNDGLAEDLRALLDAPPVERQEPDENSEWEDTFGPDYEDDSEPLEIVAVISTEQKERGHYFTPDQLQRFNRLYLKTPALSYTIELVRLKDANRLQIEVASLKSTIARLEARIAELESGRGEPVAWRFRVSSGGDWFTTTKERVADLYRGTEDGGEVEPLFTAPPAPVAVVPDERAAFDAWAVKHGRVVGYNGWRNDFEVWQARACLDATAALNGPAK